jgi:hypothetical protein
MGMAGKLPRGKKLVTLGAGQNGEVGLKSRRSSDPNLPYSVAIIIATRVYRLVSRARLDESRTRMSDPRNTGTDQVGLFATS